MVDSTPVSLLVGTVLGTLAGLGVGGGSLLILWLTLAAGMPMEEARTINLLFFIPAALINCMFRIRQQKIELNRILPAIICAILSSTIFSRLSVIIQTDLLSRLFGIILVVTGIHELFYRPRKTK